MDNVPERKSFGHATLERIFGGDLATRPILRLRSPAAKCAEYHSALSNVKNFLTTFMSNDVVGYYNNVVSKISFVNTWFLLQIE